MTEAAVVFPVVIMVVMTVIYILINMYMDAVISAKEHLALRCEAGVVTKTVERPNHLSDRIPEDKYGKKAFSGTVVITKGHRFLSNILVSENSWVYVIDERSYIRKMDLLAGVMKEDE